MRTKEIIFDEFVRAKEIYEKGFSRGDPTQRELSLLAQHIKLTTGYGETRLKRAVAEKLKELCPDWNQIVKNNREKIKKSISWAMNNPLVKFQPVPVTQKEIDAIFTAFPEDFNCQKIAFVSLVLAKGLASRDYKRKKKADAKEYEYPRYFLKSEYNWTIRQMAKVKVSSTKIPSFMYFLREKGLLGDYTRPPRFQGDLPEFFHTILFADKKDATPAIVVENFEDILSYFPKQPEKLKCERCGREIKKAKKNGKLICTWCYTKQRKEDVKLNVRKLRASKKSN